MRVVLVGLEMWNSRDKIYVSSNADTTLENFLTWWQNQGKWHLYDSVQLITCVRVWAGLGMPGGGCR